MSISLDEMRKKELSEQEWQDLKTKLNWLFPGWYSEVAFEALDGKMTETLRGVGERLFRINFLFEVRIKPTNHKQICSLCNKEILKGEKRVRLVRGESVGWSLSRFLLFSYLHFTCFERLLVWIDDIGRLAEKLLGI